MTNTVKKIDDTKGESGMMDEGEAGCSFKKGVQDKPRKEGDIGANASRKCGGQQPCECLRGIAFQAEGPAIAKALSSWNGEKRKEQEGMKSEGQEGNDVCMWRENPFRICSHNKDYGFSSERIQEPLEGLSKVVPSSQ